MLRVLCVFVVHGLLKNGKRDEGKLKMDITNQTGNIIFVCPSICYENLPSEGRNNAARPRTGCLHFENQRFRRRQVGHQVPSPVLLDVLGILVSSCLG